jgi:VWFA-related protein
MKNCMLLLAVLALSCSSAFAESPSPSGAGKLQLGVVVTDDHGAPIPGLTSNDFAVEIDGKSEAGQVQNNPPAAANPSNAGIDPRGVVVIVVDTIHSRWPEERDIRPYVAKYMGLLASRNAPVSLLILDQQGLLHPVHEYTTSSATLTAALDRADATVHRRQPSGDASPELAAETQRLVDFLKGTTANFTPVIESIRVSPEAIFAAFQSVATATATVPGRKSLIWIAHMLPFGVDKKTGRLTSPMSVGDAGGGAMNANEARDMITPDDLKRMGPIWESALAGLLQSEIALIPVAARGSSETDFDIVTQNTMVALANLTGGREIHLVGDPFKILADLPDQNRAAYSLTEDIPANGCKSNWCDVKISVKRPGARVAAPIGFFHTVSSPEPLTAASASPASATDASGIPFTVSWTAPSDSGSKKKLGFVVTFAPDAGILPAGTSELNLEITVRAMTPSGANKQNLKFAAANQLPPVAADQVRQKGLSLNHSLELAPGDYVIKFFVHNKISGKDGAVTVPLKVS